MTVWRTADPDARLTDADELGPPEETTPADAQAAVNFVVFDPEWLPEDCRVESVTRRPERPPGRPADASVEAANQTPHSEGNPCSLRTVVAGEDRRLRLKQFCYDWAPPAASVAPLWRTPEPTPFDCGDAVGWLGTDYKDNRGACVQRDRTQIELSVTAGEFSDEELIGLLDGLTPADPAGANRVRRVPFHRLNYWARYKVRPPVVPHGLWDYAPEHPYEESLVLSPVALRERSPVPALLPTGDRFVLDSALAFTEADAVEAVFRHRANASDHLWLTAADAGSPLAPSLPPEASDQSAEAREAIDLRETTVHCAALTEERGAWEALWEEDGVRYAVWAGASQELDGRAFRSVVDSLEAP
ncbi:hypothetical protein M0R89_19780 (plasmid) [Halorussus limi]|uniref:Uncharacterized protein n=1 Tax=Halorussus limi TaxID=2938695 RepID=A0A8U0I053_9EURY|nr:hypothetical protein [Halorussus limi]UPV76403.1 hypothetical protein M0R89_19780 [Halorussus limi]